MARIPDEEIERLKVEVSLERLVSAAGVELRRAGARISIRWPPGHSLLDGPPGTSHELPAELDAQIR